MKRCAMANFCTSRDCPHWGPHEPEPDCDRRGPTTDCIDTCVEVGK